MGGYERRTRIHCKPLPVLRIVYSARPPVKLGFIRGRGMAGKTIARDDLYEAVRRELGLSAHECRLLVEHVLAEIIGCLVRGETVKLTGFGVFAVRQKGERLGRNPKTGAPAPISARQIVSFKASAVLKRRINSSRR
jgi:integration host factor subunit alpha